MESIKFFFQHQKSIPSKDIRMSHQTWSQSSFSQGTQIGCLLVITLRSTIAEAEARDWKEPVDWNLWTHLKNDFPLKRGKKMMIVSLGVNQPVFESLESLLRLDLRLERCYFLFGI